MTGNIFAEKSLGPKQTRRSDRGDQTHLCAGPQLEVKGVTEVASVRVLRMVSLYAAALTVHPLVAPGLWWAREKNRAGESQ